MAAADQRAKSARAAAALKARGIYHGKRQSVPYPNSGGLTMTKGPGSAAYQRLLGKRGQR